MQEIADKVYETVDLIEREEAYHKKMSVETTSTDLTPKQIEEFAKKFHAAENTPAPPQIDMTI